MVLCSEFAANVCLQKSERGYGSGSNSSSGVLSKETLPAITSVTRFSPELLLLHLESYRQGQIGTNSLQRKRVLCVSAQEFYALSLKVCFGFCACYSMLPTDEIAWALRIAKAPGP